MPLNGWKLSLIPEFLKILKLLIFWIISIYVVGDHPVRCRFFSSILSFPSGSHNKESAYSMDRGAWRATVHGVPKSGTHLSG